MHTLDHCWQVFEKNDNLKGPNGPLGTPHDISLSEWCVRRGMEHLVIRARHHGQHGIPRDIFADKIFFNVAIPVKKGFRNMQIFSITRCILSLIFLKFKQTRSLFSVTSFEWNIRDSQKLENPKSLKRNQKQSERISAQLVYSPFAYREMATNHVNGHSLLYLFII